MERIITKWYVLVGIFILGCAFLGYGLFAQIKENNSIPSELITSAIVNKISLDNGPYSRDKYKVYVKFMVGEKEYEGYLKDLDDEVKEGDKISIYYNKENPNYFYKYDLSSFGYIMMGLGILFIFIVILILVNKIIIKVKLKLLDKKDSKKVH